MGAGWCGVLHRLTALLYIQMSLNGTLVTSALESNAQLQNTTFMYQVPVLDDSVMISKITSLKQPRSVMKIQHLQHKGITRKIWAFSFKILLDMFAFCAKCVQFICWVGRCLFSMKTINDMCNCLWEWRLWFRFKRLFKKRWVRLELKMKGKEYNMPLYQLSQIPQLPPSSVADCWDLKSNR